MKRQGLHVTVKQLEKLVRELKKEDYYRPNNVFQINIVNKKGLSDTWEIEE